MSQRNIITPEIAFLNNLFQVPRHSLERPYRKPRRPPLLSTPADDCSSFSQTTTYTRSTTAHHAEKNSIENGASVSTFSEPIKEVIGLLTSSRVRCSSSKRKMTSRGQNRTSRAAFLPNLFYVLQDRSYSDVSPVAWLGSSIPSSDNILCITDHTLG